MFSAVFEFIGGAKKTQPLKILDYNFEQVLYRSGFLHGKSWNQHDDKPSKRTNFLAQFLTNFNTIRIILTMFISDQSLGLTLCDIGILFGNTRLMGDAAFLASYLSTMAILWAFSQINHQKSHSDWIRIYLDDQRIRDWTNDVSKWDFERKLINVVYVILGSLMMGIFYIANASFIFGLLFVPDTKVVRVFQLPIWILSQGGNYILFRGVQITMFLFTSYCFITKFRLDEISDELEKLEQSDGEFSEAEVDLILGKYLDLYGDTRKSNKSLSVIVGSSYCSACAHTILMLFTALFSNATPATKLVAIIIASGTTFLAIVGYNLAGVLSTLSVSVLKFLKFFPLSTNKSPILTIDQENCSKALSYTSANYTQR